MAHHIHPPVLRRALVLATVLTLAVPGIAVAQTAGPDPARAALAAERYYGSYGAAQPLAAPTRTAEATPAAGPSWTATALGGAVLIVAAAGLGLVAGRASTRPAPRRSVTP